MGPPTNWILTHILPGGVDILIPSIREITKRLFPREATILTCESLHDSVRFVLLNFRALQDYGSVVCYYYLYYSVHQRNNLVDLISKPEGMLMTVSTMSRDASMRNNKTTMGYCTLKHAQSTSV